MGGNVTATGPDFALGVNLPEVPASGTLAGQANGEPVLLSRIDGELFAVSGTCTHYGALLAAGLVDSDTIRCPLHHACFSLRSGAALRAPAFDPLDQWRVEVQHDRAFVRRKREPRAPAAPSVSAASVGEVVIVGGGAAGMACATELRRLGHRASITMLSADRDPPCDRPNLSKDYLAGTAPEDWMSLRQESWYREQEIDLRLQADVTSIDLEARQVRCSSGEPVHFDRLLLATGSTPNRLPAEGFDGPNVLTLRSLADARGLIERAVPGSRAAIIGSSFIGLEAAAALRARGLEVDIVSPEQVPFERVFGTGVGGMLQRLHERNGVRFHLGRVAARYDGKSVVLADGTEIAGDFVLVGIGVRPSTGLADGAVNVQDGVLVDEYLETSAPGIFAAGDIARYPDAVTGERLRIEHWVFAQRQGQVAAANMLGANKSFDAVPFFWTEQYGVSLRYVGHASHWDDLVVDGDLDGGSFIARYYLGGVHKATLSLDRDREALEDERKFERSIADARRVVACTGT
jgi:apoptosis-inducing factor 3